MSTFTQRLLAGNIVIISLIMALTGWAAYSSNERHKELALARTQNLAQVLERYLATLLNKTDVTLRAMERIHELNQDARTPQAGRLELEATRRFLSDTPEINSLEIINTQAYASGDGRHDADIGETAFFRKISNARPGELIVESFPRRNPADNQWELRMARRLGSPDGKAAGAVVAGIATRHLKGIFATLDLGPHGAISLRGDALALIARHPEVRTDDKDPTGSNHVSSQLKNAIHAYPEAGTYIAPTALDGIERINAYRRISNYPMHVIVGISTETWRAEARRDMVGLATIAGSAVFITILLSLLLNRAWQRREAATLALARENERNRMLLHNASDGIHILDERGQVLEVSDSFCRMLGYTRSEVLHMNVRQWQVQNSPTDVAEALQGLMAQRDSKVFETRYQRSNGRTLDVQVHAVNVDYDGHPAIYCSTRDITDHKAAVEALQLSEHRLELASDVGEIGLWGIDLRSGETWRSTRHARIFGYTDNHGAWSIDSLLEHVVPADRQTVSSMIEKVWAQGCVEWEARIRRCDGEERWIRAKGKALHDERNELTHLLGTVVDVTDSKHTEIRLACMNASLEALAVHDPLTGLHNRRFMDETLTQVISATRHNNIAVSVILLDIDHFKAVNDTLGHAAGDHILQAVGDLLLRLVRGSDVACRYGGEEFLLVMPRVDAQQALQRAEELRKRIEELNIDVVGTQHSVTISAGIATCPDDGSTPEVLVGKADAALYAAKRAGRNCVRAYAATASGN